MGQWSNSLFAVLFLCGAFMREAHPATVSDVGGHRGAQRHLLMEQDNSTNRNITEFQSK